LEDSGRVQRGLAAVAVPFSAGIGPGQVRVGLLGVQVAEVVEDLHRLAPGRAGVGIPGGVPLRLGEVDVVGAEKPIRASDLRVARGRIEGIGLRMNVFKFRGSFPERVQVDCRCRSRSDT